MLNFLLTLSWDNFLFVNMLDFKLLEYSCYVFIAFLLCPSIDSLPPHSQLAGLNRMNIDYFMNMISVALIKMLKVRCFMYWIKSNDCRSLWFSGVRLRSITAGKQILLRSNFWSMKYKFPNSIKTINSLPYKSKDL